MRHSLEPDHGASVWAFHCDCWSSIPRRPQCQHERPGVILHLHQVDCFDVFSYQSSLPIAHDHGTVSNELLDVSFVSILLVIETITKQLDIHGGALFLL